MDINHYKQYEPIFGVWRITRLIGEGSFGKVFELEREDFGVTYKAALKAITIPSSQSEADDLMTEMTNADSVRTYYRGFVKELVEESALMSRLKGNSNIVSYENHQVIEHKDDVGWDVLIQMELLTPLNRYVREHTLTRQDVIRLGIDLCKALELCQRYNIIHRDIKPENIFISDSGDFKLGDFGIARTVEKTTGGLSKKGTYNYMAPEVYKGQPYGSTVDIYSLGIVLYRLLNENRTPFLPAYPAPITHQDRDSALAKRFNGVPIPRPVNGDGRLGEIVLKACAYEPKERYSSPAQMRQELESILYNRADAPYIYPQGDEVEQKSVEYVQTGATPPDAASQDSGTSETWSDGETVSAFSAQTEETLGAFSAERHRTARPESKPAPEPVQTAFAPSKPSARPVKSLNFFQSFFASKTSQATLGSSIQETNNLSGIHRNRTTGKTSRTHTVAFGEWGLAAAEPGLITSAQIEAARLILSRYKKRHVKVWIKVFSVPHVDSNKDFYEYWGAEVNPGYIMFEISGLSEESTQEALHLVARELPIKCEIVKKETTKDKA